MSEGVNTFMREMYIIMNFHIQSLVLRSDMMTTVGKRKVHDELKKDSFKLHV